MSHSRSLVFLNCPNGTFFTAEKKGKSCVFLIYYMVLLLFFPVFKIYELKKANSQSSDRIQVACSRPPGLPAKSRGEIGNCYLTRKIDGKIAAYPFETKKYNNKIS